MVETEATPNAAGGISALTRNAVAGIANALPCVMPSS